MGGGVMGGFVLGLTGPAGSGKDTVAGILCGRHGMMRMAFADPLRDALRAMFGLADDAFAPGEKEQVIPWLGRSPRELLQTLGTEWGRNMVGPDVWVRALERRALLTVTDGRFSTPGWPPKNIVVSDVRMNNEADWVRENGFLVRIVGRAADGVRSHASERGVSWTERDLTIDNSGTIDDLVAQVDRAVAVVVSRAHIAECLA